jgi:hypothetical protein
MGSWPSERDLAMIALTRGIHHPRHEDAPVIDIGKTIATRVNELRLRAALEEAHRARLAFLREDQFDGDCARCVRRVREAEARAARLEAALRAARSN